MGIPEQQIQQAAKTNVCKINIASDGYLVTKAMIQKFFTNSPARSTPEST